MTHDQPVQCPSRSYGPAGRRGDISMCLSTDPRTAGATLFRYVVTWL
jgi:DNA replicative helicase MCM subunit Mcm2 (Cdc46/Mcm family)